MKDFREYAMGEKSWTDPVTNWLQHQLHKKDYEEALGVLNKLVQRKKQESPTGKLMHDIVYYATVVAKTYVNVDGIKLSQLYNDQSAQAT